jgi:MATE family multidrug resistance protein
MALPEQYRSFLPRFYRLTAVSTLSNMMIPLAGLCDTAFLGHLQDIRYLAGVILGSVLFDYLYRVLKFLRSSTNAITAQAVGNEDEEGILLAGLRSGVIAIALSVTMLLLQYPIAKLGFFVLSGSPAIEASGLDYFNARIWGAPAVLLNFVFLGWFLGREMNGVVFLMSLVGNASNVGLDYLMINRWGWGSMGAGLATALSQYLTLGVALIAAGLTINWKVFLPAAQKLGDKAALKATVILKGNILVRFLGLISTYAIFTNLSASFGTEILAINGLLLQIALLSQFTVQGVGMTNQTLTGNFKGKGEVEKMMPLLTVSILTAITIASGFALTVVLFPQTVFSLLTNHTEISQGVNDYTIWLLPLLGITAIAFMLEGYFIGLKEGAKLRNGVLLAFLVGFLPLALTAWYFQNNHLLWTALTTYMALLMLGLGVQIPSTQESYRLKTISD